MKSVKTLLVCLAATMMAVAASAQAQNFLDDPRYGATPEERQTNVLELQFFRDAFNNRDYDTALKHLRVLLAGAPTATENLYINGKVIYKTKILRATSMDEKRAYVDTLMAIYDMHLANYGTQPARTASILANKAREYLAYNPTAREEIRALFRNAIEVSGASVDLAVANVYFNELANDFKSGEIEADVLLDEYERLAPAFDRAGAEEQKLTFETIFAQSTAASPENLEAIYRPQIEANPSDSVLLARVFNLLRRAGAKDNFILEVGEKYYAAAPKSETAVLLAMLFEDRREYSKSLIYLNENIARETDPLQKANLLVRAAASQLGAGNARQAADLARQAADANPENGYAYLMLGNAYAAGANGCAEFERRTVYWLVYDTLARARTILSEGDADAKQQAANLDSQLGGYRASFPTKEDCFFRGLSNGDGYSVNCGWVTGRTSVRER